MGILSGITRLANSRPARVAGWATRPFFDSRLAASHPRLAASIRYPYRLGVLGGPAVAGYIDKVNAAQSGLRQLMEAAGESPEAIEAATAKLRWPWNHIPLVAGLALDKDPVARLGAAVSFGDSWPELRYGADDLLKRRWYSPFLNAARATSPMGLAQLGLNWAVADPTPPDQAGYLNRTLRRELPRIAENPSAALQSPTLRRLRELAFNESTPQKNPNLLGSLLRGRYDEVLRARPAPELQAAITQSAPDLADLISPAPPERLEVDRLDAARYQRHVRADGTVLPPGTIPAGHPYWAATEAANQAATRTQETAQTNLQNNFQGAWEAYKNRKLDELHNGVVLPLQRFGGGLQRAYLGNASSWQDVSRNWAGAAGRAAGQITGQYAVPIGLGLGALAGGLFAGKKKKRLNSAVRGGLVGAATGAGLAGGAGLSTYLSAKNPDMPLWGHAVNLGLGSVLGAGLGYGASRLATPGLDEEEP